MTPDEFLTSIGEGIVINEKNPMETVGNFVADSFDKNIERDADASRNDKPPDLRVAKISATGEMNLKFTSEMEFPEDILDEPRAS